MIRVLVRAKPDRSHLSLYYLDPHTGREVSRSAGTSDPKAAQRAAALWEQELVQHRGADGTRWEWFQTRFEDEHLAGLAPKTRKCYHTALNAFRKAVAVDSLADINAGTLSSFKASLLKAKRPTSTVANYLRHLLAALRWAEEVGMIREAPTVGIPSTGRRLLMRGRPLTETEYRLMLDACATPAERRFLELLWFSGLRLGEALRLSWDRGPIRVNLDAKYPHISFEGEAQKSRQDATSVIPPDFALWLKRTPQDARAGRVAPWNGPRGKPMGMNKASVRITDIGAAAGVKVNDKGKAASAHDLRRSFGRRWALKVPPAILQAMMRHADLSTTMLYYAGIDSDDVGQVLWGSGPADVPKTDPDWEGIG